MSDAVHPRKSGPWPLLAITLLVLLLTAFLVVRFRKQGEEKPVVVKEAPPPPVVVETPLAPLPPDPPKPVEDPGSKDLNERIAEAKKALEERRWEAAGKALEAVAHLKPDAPEIAGLREKLAAGRMAEDVARQEVQAKEEARRRRDLAWLAARDRIEKAQDVNRWDEAAGVVDALLKEHPDLEKVEDFSAARKKLGELRGESDRLFTKEMADAEKLFEAKRFAQASTSSEKGLRYYPERQAAVRAFQDKVRAAKLESEMVRIPDAACWIGHEANADEKPLRQVKLPPFYIDRYETTNEDYQTFVVATGHAPPPHWGGKAVPKGGDRHPVAYVSYADASAYAAWAGKRLPTADEWEVAARGPDRREYPWGNAFSEKENVFPCNSLEYWQVIKAAPTTLPVDAPSMANGESAFRVYGMGGNVWEWTSGAVAGKSGESLLEFRVLKGGSFMNASKALRCANRLPEDPRLILPYVGFRCARDAK